MSDCRICVILVLLLEGGGVGPGVGQLNSSVVTGGGGGGQRSGSHVLTD